MEFTLSTTTTTVLTVSKTLNPKVISLLHQRILTSVPIRGQVSNHRRIFNSELHSLHKFRSLSAAAAVRPVRSRLQCVSSSAASFASGGGGGVGIGGRGSGGGGDGDGALDGRNEKASSVADVSDSSSDVIVLDVGGMSCGGCAASVKRILETQPQVSSASVNLTTETAVVWPVSEAKAVPNWQKNLGVELAKHLTSCGFKSNLRGEGPTAGDIPS